MVMYIPNEPQEARNSLPPAHNNKKRKTDDDHACSNLSYTMAQGLHRTGHNIISIAKSTGLITYCEAVHGDVDDLDDGDVHHDISE